MELQCLENLVVGEEGDLRSGTLCLADILDLRHGLAAFVALVVDATPAAHFDLHPFAQRVHTGHAYAMEAARDLVAVVVKLAARVKDRHHDFQRRLLLRRVDVHGDATSVVDDRDRTVRIEDNLDVAAVSRQRLVHAVVDHLEYAVVKTPGPGIADVHGRAFSHGIHAPQHGDRLRIVRATGGLRLRLRG